MHDPSRHSRDGRITQQLNQHRAWVVGRGNQFALFGFVGHESIENPRRKSAEAARRPLWKKSMTSL